jgi:uncharacterized protein (DUF1501 family)
MKISRRYFLKSTGALAAYCGLSPLSVFSQEQLAAIDNPALVRRGKTLVTIFLRGGMDGLNMVVPYGDADYYRLRPKLAIGRPGVNGGGALDLDGFFGLNPSAKALHPLFQRGDMVAIQAVGYSKNTRSHFEEQDVWETGIIGNTVNSDGWLNRHLVTSQGNGTVRAISIGDNLPRILRGNAAAYAVRGIKDLAAPESYGSPDTMAAALEYAYSAEPNKERDEADDLVSASGTTTLEGIKQIHEVMKVPYQPGAKYPEKNRLAKQLEEAARLIKADIGLEVVGVDYGGWDTHNNQGGSYDRLTRELAEALAAFSQDLGDRMNDVLVLTLSDFGRTAEENGTAGTDHGWANCMLAMGGGVAAKGNNQKRPVLGNWPGLSPEQLHQKRDLKHTTDFRDVLGEVVTHHLGNSNVRKILPGHEFKPVGIV